MSKVQQFQGERGDLIGSSCLGTKEKLRFGEGEDSVQVSDYKALGKDSGM